jgi:hypothetical protein
MKSQSTNIAAEILGAAGIGAALMYYSTPTVGRGGERSFATRSCTRRT